MDTWAIVTGASSGIGLELAKLLARDRFNLVLVARNAERLEKVAIDLGATYQIYTKILALDLADADSARTIFSAVCDIPVSVLVNNAGFGWLGPFSEGDLEHSLDMMHTNMDALVKLTYLFAKPMAGLGGGRILNVASTAAFQPGPFTAIYYATKAFVFSFSMAMADELAPSRVTVTTLCPGFTDTEFQARSGMERPFGWLPNMSAEKVARLGYRGLMKGAPLVIPGFFNKVTAAISRALPARLTARFVRRINNGKQRRG